MRQRLIVLLVVITLLSLGSASLFPLATSSVNAASQSSNSTSLDNSPALAPSAVAWDMVNTTSQNLNSHTNAFAGAFSSGGDGFEKYQRAVSPSIPFDIMDDSLVTFPADTQGIIDDNNLDEFFGAADTINTDNPAGAVTATWEFDISGAVDVTSISIDMGAMGDFEAASDSFDWSYQIDAGAVNSIVTSSVDEAAAQNYTLAGGAVVNLNDPLSANGTLLNNVLQTITVPIAGSGTTLTLTLTLDTNGGGEGFAFQDIVIMGNGAPGAIAWDMVNTTSQNLNSHTNAFAGAFSSGGDGFEKYQRAVSPSIPFDIMDDSLVTFPADTQGIIDDNNLDEFFGAADTINTDNPAGAVTAIWEFDISSASSLTELSIDMGAMGDFEAASDSFDWSYQIDAGAVNSIVTSSVDEAATQNYTLAGGAVVNLSDPLSANGTLLNNVLQTITVPIAGSGTTLTLTLTLDTNGGGEGFAFQDIVIMGIGGGGGGTPTDPIINEFVFNHTGISDTDEFIEVYGDASTDYSAFSLLVVEGDGADAGVIDNVIAVGSTDANGYWTTGFLTDNFENSTQTILLVDTFTGAVSNDIDANNDGTIDNILWTSIVDDIGVADADGGDFTYGVELAQNYDGDATTVGGASRIPNATDTDAVGDWTRNDFDGDGLPSFVATADPGEAINTPGAENAVVPPLPPMVLIHDIQGSGPSVVNPGLTVTVQGIVVGDYQEDDELDGFFLQEETTDIDGDGATSEGIFIYCGNNCPATYPDVAEGDLVTVTGMQEEQFSMSQLDVPAAGGSIVIDTPAAGIGLVTPASIDLPVPGGFATVDEYYEQFEGMLVNFVDTMTVTEHFQLFRYGELMISEGGRLTQYTQDGTLPLNAIDLAANLDDAARRSLFLDDLNNIQSSPNPVYHPQPNGFSATTYVRGGSTIASLTGVLHWSWAGQSGTDAWRIRPQITNPVTFVNAVRPSTPTPGGNITVAGFNVLNYFNGDGLGGGFPTSRGADSVAEFDRQTDKIVSAIVAIDADVMGLMEIENDAAGTEAAVDDLVNALNAATAPNTYAYVASGVDGTDEIKVALIYKPGVVTPAGVHQVLDTPAFVTPNGTGSNRPALAQTFQVTDAGNPDNGAAFTVVVLHLKSKGSNCSGAPDDDLTTGQGNCNGTRTAAATELISWIGTDPTDTATNLGAIDTDFLIIGDFNAYYQEDPMQEFYNASYSNVLTAADYSYVFSGAWGSLDHGVSSSSLTSQVVGADSWHISSEENSLLDYNDTVLDPSEASFHVKPNSNGGLYLPDQFRASDHDPIIIGLDLTVPVPPAPGNDLIDDAFVFTGTASNQEIAHATLTGSDPALHCAADYVNSVWYTYTAPADEYFTFTTTSLSGSLNPVLGVFSGVEGALNTLGCATDTVTATTSVNLASGQTYTIMVAHASTTQITTSAEFNLNSSSVAKNDAVTLFDPATSNTGLLDSVQNSPNEFAYVNTPPTSANSEWVMGDWNADGVKTPGIFDNGAFRYTNDLGITANWSTGFWLGNAPGRVAVVAGRFDNAFANDCIAWVDSNLNGAGNLRFSLKYWCDMTTTPQSIPAPLLTQWLSAPLNDSQGFVGTHQWVYGDWDNDNLDEPGVRRGSRITRSTNAPTEGAALYGAGMGQRWDTSDGDGPGAHGLDDGLLVAGDWDGDGTDTWGVVYDNSDFYYRDVFGWNPGPFEFGLQTFTATVSTPWQVDSHHAASGGSSSPAPAAPTFVNEVGGGTVDTSRNVEADLAVTKSGNYTVGEVGLVGDSIVWTITLTNTGTAPANGVQITDNVPSELRVDDALANDGTISVRGQVVTFSIESIGVGETAQFQVVTTILNQPSNGLFNNSVNVLVPDGNSGGSDANLVASGTVESVDGLPATGYAPQLRW